MGFFRYVHARILLLLAGVAGVFHRQTGARFGVVFQFVRRLWHCIVAGRAEFFPYRREHRPAADQGADAAFGFLWRFGGGGDAGQHGLVAARGL